MPGRGSGRGMGKGMGRGQTADIARGLGKGDGQGLGASGACICPKCGYRTTHAAGGPCMEQRCPSCGSVLLREGSVHHQKAQKVQASRQKKNES